MAFRRASSAVLDLYNSVRQQTPNPAKLPSKYEDFVSRNSSSVGQIESALRSLTYIIPGRFHEAEIASESLHTFISLLSLYHDRLLHRVYTSLPQSIPRPLSPPHNRYTRYWSQSSTTYNRVSVTLQTIKYTELLCEMAAKRRSDALRWRIVVFLEAIKALCRFMMMRLTNSRPLVSPPLPYREADPREVLEKERGMKIAAQNEGQWDGMDVNDEDKGKVGNADSVNGNATGYGSAVDLEWTMPRTGLSLPSLPDADEINEFLLKKVLKADDIKAPKQLLHRVTALRGQAAEILWILRPVLYALVLQQIAATRGRDGGKKKSWTPWVLGVGMELVARNLMKTDLEQRVPGGSRGLTGLEREEFNRRGWSMGWWALRGAFYDQVTRGAIQGFANKFKGKPLIDIVGAVVEDYAYLWDEYYFSTASM